MLSRVARVAKQRETSPISVQKARADVKSAMMKKKRKLREQGKAGQERTGLGQERLG